MLRENNKSLQQRHTADSGQRAILDSRNFGFGLSTHHDRRFGAKASVERQADARSLYTVRIPPNRLGSAAKLFG